jgi:hypothetical protein
MLSMLSWLISFIYNPQTHTNDESIDEIDKTKDSISVESNEILDNDGDIVEHFTKKTEDFNIKNNYIDTITHADNTTKIHAVEAIENNSIKDIDICIVGNCDNIKKSENEVGLDNQIDKITSPSDAIVPDSAISADNNISSPSISSIEKRDSTSGEDIYPEKINKKKRKRKRNKNKQRKNRKKYNKKKNKY